MKAIESYQIIARVMNRTHIQCHGAIYKTNFVIVPASCVSFTTRYHSIQIQSVDSKINHYYHNFIVKVHPRYKKIKDLRFNLALIFIPGLDIPQGGPDFFTTESELRLGILKNNISKEFSGDYEPRCNKPITLIGLQSSTVLCSELIFLPKTKLKLSLGFITLSKRGNRWGLASIAPPPIDLDSKHVLVIQLKLIGFQGWIEEQEKKLLCEWYQRIRSKPL